MLSSSSSPSPEPKRPSRWARALALGFSTALLGVLVLKSGVACASTMPIRAGTTYLPDAGMSENNLPPPPTDPPRRVESDAGPAANDDDSAALQGNDPQLLAPTKAPPSLFQPGESPVQQGSTGG
jgi:hypothetical protein